MTHSRLHNIIYTVIVIALICMTIATFDYKGRMESAQEQRDFYFDSLNQSIDIWQGYESAFKNCDRELRDRVCDKEIRELRHNISMIQSEITFNSIDSNLDNIMDNLDCVSMMIDKNNEIKDLKEQLETQ